MRYLRILAVGWWMQMKIRARSPFDGLLGVLWPLFFATTALLMARAGSPEADLFPIAVGASVLGVWSSAATSGAALLQRERWGGTLELLAAAPVPFGLVILPMTLALATMGLASMGVTLLVARFAFGIEVRVEQPLVFGVAVVATVVSVALLTYVLAFAAVRYRASWALGNMVEIPVWLISGFLVPLSLLPEWVRPLSWVLAPTWGVEAVRRAALGGSPWAAIGACVLLGALYAALGAYLSRRLLTSARRHATLALS